jgi:hypothetical protein
MSSEHDPLLLTDPSRLGLQFDADEKYPIRACNISTLVSPRDGTILYPLEGDPLDRTLMIGEQYSITYPEGVRLGLPQENNTNVLPVIVKKVTGRVIMVPSGEKNLTDITRYFQNVR